MPRPALVVSRGHQTLHPADFPRWVTILTSESAGAHVTKTQTSTLLFTDIVGSTELSSRVDPETADRLRQNHFSLLRQALAASDGVEVKNLGDGLMAVFPSPSAAVSCAVTMQQTVEQDNNRSDNPLGLRIGLSCGEVTIEDDDYFGDPVVEAARLCALCEGGQILTAQTVRIMAGRRSPHTFSDFGDRELKGLPDPVAVCEVGWTPVAVSSGVPLPERLESPSDSLFGFVGRGAQIQRLTERVKKAADGTRSVSFLSGEPGIGKTTLSRKVAQVAHHDGLCVLYGRCDEDLAVSYQPFAEALGHLVAHCDERLLTDHVADHGGALLTLVPQMSKRLPDLQATQTADPDSEQSRLFSGVVGLLAAASSETGLLLVIDDLHWTDRASLQLLRHVAGSAQLSHVVILGTYRDSDLTTGHPLTDTLASLTREADVDRIDLMGLEDFEIIEMMEQVAGHDLDRDGVDLAHAVRRETDGNPFFTTELLRHLGETGLVHQDESGHWVASDDLFEQGLPPSVRVVVGQRVDRLGEEMRKVLSQAAVIGREFEVDVLAAVVGNDEDQLLDLIDQGVQAGLLAEVEGKADRLSFAHALTQHTLYEDLGATRRARTHRRIAEVLEAMYGTAPDGRAAELARHFVAATKTADAAKALNYCKLAGDQALAQIAPADALGWFSQALDLYPQIPSDENLRCELMIGLGTAQRRSGDPSHRGTLIDAADLARTIGDIRLLVASALANNRSGVTASGQVDLEKVSVLESALEAVGTHDSRERALLLGMLGSELAYATDTAGAKNVRDAALEMARRLDDSATFLRVTACLYAEDFLPETLDQRRDDLDRAVLLATAIADPLSLFRANLDCSVACLQSGDLSGFHSHLVAAEEVAEHLGDLHQRWSAMIVRGLSLTISGDLARAEEQANAAFLIGTEGAVPEATAVLGAQLIQIYGQSGRSDDLSTMAELMAAAADENPGLPILRAGLALTYCDLGRDEEALGIIEGDFNDGFRRFPHDTTWAASLGVLAEVCVHFQRDDLAELLYGWLRPWNRQVFHARVSCQGPAAFHLASLATTLGHHESANLHFTEALEMGEGLGSPYWTARTQIEWAQLERISSGSGTKRAEKMLATALDTANRFGFRFLIKRVEDLLS
jgi:class 3 adenylate cyclase